MSQIVEVYIHRFKTDLSIRAFEILQPYMEIEKIQFLRIANDVAPQKCCNESFNSLFDSLS